MKTPRTVTGAVSFVACFLAMAGTAWGQPVSTSASSVEWVAAHSCLIARAVIEDVSVHALKDGLHAYQGIHRYQTVTVRVLETLKGEHSERLRFVQDGDFGAIDLADLQKNKQELLLFLEPWMRSGKFDRSQGGYAYTRFPLIIKDVLVLKPKDVRWAFTDVPALSRKLQRLSTPQQAMDTIRSYLRDRKDQEPARGVTIKLPPRLRGGYHEVSFTFPADREADVKTPALDFETFKKKFAKQPPAEKKPPYLRTSSGYVGVHALELMAADCDVIVRGVIEEFCFVARTEDPIGDSHGIKFRVVETIKGQTPKQITCFVSDARDLETLRRDKQELILFLQSNRNRADGEAETALAYRTRAGLWDDSVIVLDREVAEVLFADLTWHRDPQEILARLRVAAKSSDKTDVSDVSPAQCPDTALPVFHVHPPTSIAAGSSIAGNPYSIISLPVNSELEKNARKWAVAENKDRRWLAARAMVYFKSDKNAAVLKKLLDDEAAWDRREMLRLTGLGYPHRPEFLVRWEAWHVLAGWGYEVPKPRFTQSR